MGRATPSAVVELSGCGVEFCSEVVDEGYGLVTFFQMPGNLEVQLYQPLYVRGAT